MRNLLLLVVAVVLLSSGCVTARVMNQLEPGMHKRLVVAKLGEPASVSAKDGVEYLNYRFPESDWDWWLSVERFYYVRIIDSKVESFGRQGDFDSTKDPKRVVKVETRASSAAKEDRLDTLKKLHELRQSGALTEEEYQAQKAKVLE